MGRPMGSKNKSTLMRQPKTVIARRGRPTGSRVVRTEPAKAKGNELAPIAVATHLIDIGSRVVRLEINYNNLQTYVKDMLAQNQKIADVVSGYQQKIEELEKRLASKDEQAVPKSSGNTVGIQSDVQ